jgi:hypothetical protein
MMAAGAFEDDLAGWLAGYPERTPGEGKAGFKLDPSVTKDLARYLWAPRSKVWSDKDGQFHERDAEVVLGWTPRHVSQATPPSSAA